MNKLICRKMIWMFKNLFCVMHPNNYYYFSFERQINIYHSSFLNNRVHLHVNLVEWCYSFNLLHVPSLLDTMTLMPSCRLFTCSIAPFQNINYIWCAHILMHYIVPLCFGYSYSQKTFLIWDITLLTLNKILQYCRYMI